MAPCTVATRAASSTRGNVTCNASQKKSGSTINLYTMGGALLGQTVAAKMAMADEMTTFSPPQVTIPAAAAPAADSGIGDLFSDNPLLLAGIAGIIAVPVAINVISKVGAGAAGGVKMTNPAKALEALEDSRVVLVDIRSKAEIKLQGNPDLKAVKRSALSIPFTKLVKGEYVVDEMFGEKLAKARGVDEDSIIILLDADGSESKEAAKLVEGVDKVYILQGGAAAWAATGPWKEPGKGLSLPDLKGVGSSLNNMAEEFKEAPSLNKAVIGLGAIAGAGLFLVNEAEVLIELAGIAAAANFGFNLLFSDSKRGSNTTEIKEIVDEKVAEKEVVSDSNKIPAAVVDDSDTEQGEVAPMAQANAAKDPNTAEAAEWIANWKGKSN